MMLNYPNETTSFLFDNIELFNTHEKWGILIACLCFVAGFPSNLLSIFVCFKSLVRYNYTRALNTYQQLQQQQQQQQNYLMNNELTQQTTATMIAPCKRRKSSTINLQQLNLKSKTKSKNKLQFKFNNKEKLSTQMTPILINEASIFEDQPQQQQQQQQQQQLPANNKRKTTSASLNQVITIRGRLSAYNKAVNPHRKCFELYLIEISICDVIILTYHFIEWVLLILSRYNLIDKLYSEPIYISQFMCRFVIALNRTVILLHNWLVALLALTRCYAIYKPLNSHILFSSKFYCRLNLYIVFGLLVLFITANSFGVAMLTHTKTPLGTANTNYSNQTILYKIECKFKEDLYKKYKYLDVYTNLAIGIIGYSLPIIITLIINLALIFNLRQLLLYKTNRLRYNSSFNEHTTPLNFKAKPSIASNAATAATTATANLNRIKFFKTTGSLLFISFSYLICYIPFTLLFLFLSLDKLNMNVDLIFILTNLRYFNHTLNFFIYYATGKRFRNDVKAFLNCKN